MKSNLDSRMEGREAVFLGELPCLAPESHTGVALSAIILLE